MSYEPLSPEMEKSIQVSMSSTFFDKLLKSGSVTIASCLKAIEEAGLSSGTEASPLRALSQAIQFAPPKYKGRAKEIANMVVRSEIFSVMPKEDRRVFLDASSWMRPYNWLMGVLEPGRRFWNRFVRFKIRGSETEQDDACRAAVQVWQTAMKEAKKPDEVRTRFETSTSQLIAAKKGPRKEMYSIVFSAFFRQIQKTTQK